MGITDKCKPCISEPTLPSLHPLIRRSSDKDTASCPICLTADATQAPILSLACNHVICAPCGETATRHGIMTCPMCRAPHVLDIRMISERLDEQRNDYRAWRNGEPSGMKGDIDVDSLVTPDNAYGSKKSLDL